MCNKLNIHTYKITVGFFFFTCFGDITIAYFPLPYIVVVNTHRYLLVITLRVMLCFRQPNVCKKRCIEVVFLMS